MSGESFSERIQGLSPVQRKLLAEQLSEKARNNHQPTDSQRLVAYVVADEDLDLASLRNYTMEHLPDYMVPAAIVQIEELPRLPNGKINFEAFPSLEEDSATLQSEHVEPRTAVEQQLAKIWEEVLSVQPVGVHDNFFEIGGDSILSIQIIAMARKAGLAIAPGQLIEHQTIAALALFVQPTDDLQKQAQVSSGPALLTPIQQWFFEVHQA
ncbi:MAG: phosphopantetheine-binding protein, partial [Cyclobacteriaceae bacterium]